MAKLIVMAFTIATLLALASAHQTIITTTTIEEDDTNPSSQQQQYCGQHLQGQQLRQCQAHLQQPESLFPFPQQQQTLQQCCQELRNVNQQCQCNAVKKIFGEVQQQQQQGGPFAGIFGSLETQRLKQRAENLPNQCNLQTGRQCRVKTGGQCRQEVQVRQFNRCQRYLEQQTGFEPSNPEEIREQCCQELRNVEVECQCEAMKEVFNQGMQQQQQGQHQRPQMQRMVEDLKNRCNLEVQQCRISSGMF